MNLLDLCGDIHYLINQEIKKTEHFNLRVHKDKFKKVLIDIGNFNYELEDITVIVGKIQDAGTIELVIVE